jgi:hypothetical protein
MHGNIIGLCILIFDAIEKYPFNVRRGIMVML